MTTTSLSWTTFALYPPGPDMLDLNAAAVQTPRSPLTDVMLILVKFGADLDSDENVRSICKFFFQSAPRAVCVLHVVNWNKSK